MLHVRALGKGAVAVIHGVLNRAVDEHGVHGSAPCAHAARHVVFSQLGADLISHVVHIALVILRHFDSQCAGESVEHAGVVGHGVNGSGLEHGLTHGLLLPRIGSEKRGVGSVLLHLTRHVLQDILLGCSDSGVAHGVGGGSVHELQSQLLTFCLHVVVTGNV